MNIKEFNSLEEIEKYYDEKSNTFIFKENGNYIDLVVFNFDFDAGANIEAGSIDALNITALNIRAWNVDSGDLHVLNIDAWDIYACDIEVKNIEAWDIKARNIVAQDINYYAVCYAGNNIKCKSIKGRKRNAKHFVLDGKLETENDQTI